jgi:hypothetical protein
MNLDGNKKACVLATAHMLASMVLAKPNDNGANDPQSG